MTDLISRQAAIDAAIKADMENNSNVLSEKRARVIDRHISAVPSAQPEPCEDAVSRDSVSKWLDRWEGYIDKDMINRMQYKVCDIPSVKPDIPTVDTPTVVPTCEDTISRQDAIRVASGYCHPANIAKELAKLPSAQPEPFMVTIDHELTKDEVERLKQSMSNTPIVLFPSVQPEPQWIPCSERLPEELYETGNGRQFSNYVLVTVYNKYDDDLFVDVGYTVDGNWLSATVTNPIPIELFNVLAWMPLPEPYTEEGEPDVSID